MNMFWFSFPFLTTMGLFYANARLLDLLPQSIFEQVVDYTVDATVCCHSLNAPCPKIVVDDLGAESYQFVQLQKVNKKFLNATKKVLEKIKDYDIFLCSVCCDTRGEFPKFSKRFPLFKILPFKNCSKDYLVGVLNGNFALMSKYDFSLTKINSNADLIFSHFLQLPDKSGKAQFITVGCAENQNSIEMKFLVDFRLDPGTMAATIHGEEPCRCEFSVEFGAEKDCISFYSRKLNFSSSMQVFRQYSFVQRLLKKHYELRIYFLYLLRNLFQLFCQNR